MRRLLSIILATVALAVLFGYLDVRDLRRGDARPTATAEVGDGRRDLFVLPDDGAAVILDEFARAGRTIDIAVYLLTSDDVVASLDAAVERGVRVRVLLEPDPYGGYGDVEADAAHLRALGVEVRFSGKDVRFGHIKTFVVDERVALVTSLNLTNAALTANRELGVISTERDVVTTAVALFEADWTTSAFDDPGPLVISPLNGRGTIETLIDSAAATIDVYAEVIRDETVVSHLIKRSSDGVVVRVIVPDEVSPDDAGIYRRLAGSGIEVRSIGRPYQHAKMLLVDSERALIGSINFTQTSMDDNREAGIVLDDPLSLERLAAVYETDWASGRSV